MKLFQRLLLAPAALGLMVPVAANADIAFSSTTTLSGSAVFTGGSVTDGGSTDEENESYMQYGYALDLNSSFSGDDLMYVGLEAGNASGPLSNMDSATSTTNSRLTVHSLFYTFPIGDLEVTAGPLVDQDDVVAATTSAYSDAFRLGAMPYSLAGSETGPGVGVTYSTDNGVVSSASFVSADGNNPTLGINTGSGDDVATFTLGYDGDGFGGGVVYATNDGHNEASTSYDAFGAGIYYSPETFDATISLAYDTKNTDTSFENDWFVGIDIDAGPGTLSAAYNQTDVDNSTDLDQAGFEVSYSYPVNDNFTITPGFFSVEETTADKEDDVGAVIEAVFSF
tara:strand:- start:627 stop:1643 length:1017 start_codon:yes stop_codon:yes gene_type:complete